MVHSHDYYVHLTWFDRCQAVGTHWLSSRVEGWRPNLWSWAFNLFAVLCYFALAMIVADFSLAAGSAAASVSGLQSVATTLAVAMALGAGVQFQRLARLVNAETLRKRRAQSRSPAHASRPGSGHKPERRLKRQQAMRAFFLELRAAGVDVSIARALLAAGIHTPRRLAAVDDRVLLQIQAMDAATVRRLRRHFSASRQPARFRLPVTGSSPA